jgi:UDP-glucose 4-epimerase
MIALTGESGWLGREIAAQLQSHGGHVRRLGRGRGGEEQLELTLPAEHPQWDVALAGCAVVVHAAAHVHRPIESPAELALFEAINVQGTAKLLAAAKRAGAKRFVFISSIAVYGANFGEVVAENAALAPTTAYGRSKKAAEDLVRASGLDWVIVRPATIFGTGDRANFHRLAQALQRRRFFVPGAGEARKSVLPVALAGELIAEIATRPIPPGTVMNLALPDAPSLREVCDAFSAACGWPQARSVPLLLLRGTALVGDGLAALGLRFPLTTSTLSKLTTHTQVDTAVMRTLLPRDRWPSFATSLAQCARSYASV